MDNQNVIGLAYNDPKILAFYVWVYCILWWFVQDGCKVLVYYYLKSYNVFGINDSLKLSEGFADLNTLVDDVQKPLLANSEDDGGFSMKHVPRHSFSSSARFIVCEVFTVRVSCSDFYSFLLGSRLLKR